jgi:hypothetical protein
MSGKEYVAVSTLVEYMKTLENEMRDIRQRLERIERNMILSKYNKAPTKADENLSRIEPIAKELIKTIESSKAKRAEPLNLLTVPEVPQRIIEIQSVLNELDQ